METENIPVPADLEVSFLRSRVPSQRCVVYEVQSSQFTFHRKFQPRSCSQWSFSKWAEWIKLGSGEGFNLVAGSPFSGGIPSPEINAVAKVSCLSSSLIREHESQVVSGTYEFLLPISLKTALDIWFFLKNCILVPQESPCYLQFLSGPLRHAGKWGVRMQGAKVSETSAFPVLLLPVCSFPASVVPEIFQAYNG